MAHIYQSKGFYHVTHGGEVKGTIRYPEHAFIISHFCTIIAVKIRPLNLAFTMKYRTYNLIFFSFFLTFSLLLSAQSGKESASKTKKPDNYFEISKNLDIYVTLFKELNTYYVDELNPSELIQTSIRAMLKSLDPYTVFFSESEIEDVKYLTTGNYGGVGSMIAKKGDYVVVTEPYEGFPADKSGIIAGDLILEIDGKSAKGMSTSDISTLLKGQPGTEVKVLIERMSLPKPLEIIIKREVIQIPNIPYYGMLPDDIAYINISQFKNNTTDDVKKALLTLQTQHKVKGLVLDLRGNPGGLLIESVRLAGLFVDKNELIVSTRGKVESWNKEYKTSENPIAKDLPLIILVNGGSASASEIVAGALQDLDRAVIIGQKTLGKGLVQTTRSLSYNTSLKVTTSKYYIPSGRCIQEIDYSHRDDKGVASKVPDSLISEFKTRNGRKVVDGKGVFPDISLELSQEVEIIRSLLQELIIFDYATFYKTKNEKISSPEEFEITDAMYDDFVAYVNEKSLQYKTATEKSLEDLRKKAEKEKYFELISDEYSRMTDEINAHKKKELYLYKDDIKRLLEQEIVLRYYYRKGRIQLDLKKNKEVLEALQLFSNPEKYNSILRGQN
jgi:carboxyl-terminal processing protease